MERLSDACETIDLCLLQLKCLQHSFVYITHLVQLRGDLSRKFHAVFYGGIRFKRLTLDFLQKVWTPTQKLVM